MRDSLNTLGGMVSNRHYWIDTERGLYARSMSVVYRELTESIIFLSIVW